MKLQVASRIKIHIQSIARGQLVMDENEAFEPRFILYYYSNEKRRDLPLIKATSLQSMMLVKIAL
jgi:hypothetical protein